MKRVVIIYESMPQYRLRFFNRLKFDLSEKGIMLDVLYGVRDEKLDNKKDRIALGWGTIIKNSYFRLPGGANPIVYQHCLRDTLKADLVIFQQENKYIINYIFQLLKLFNKKRKIAFWGHGKNFQAGTSGYNWKESIKRIFCKHVDWWFVYNDLSANIVKNNGFPESRITSVYNSIDTNYLRSIMAGIDSEKLTIIKKEIGLKDGPVGIYCGSMYKEKRIAFLIDAVKKIQEKIPRFQMLFVGAGPDSILVEKEAAVNSNIYNIGPKLFEDAAPYFMLSDIQLMPGAVGLGIVDSFVYECPLITTHGAMHGPEIDYLKNLENGVIIADNLQEYVNTTIGILSDNRKLKKLKDGCVASSYQYSIENMSSQFVNGILRVLES